MYIYNLYKVFLIALYILDKYIFICKCIGFSSVSKGKESACNVVDLSWIPESGRSPGEGNDYSLQYYSLRNSMDRGNWQDTVHGVAKSEWLTYTQTQTYAPTHIYTNMYLYIFLQCWILDMFISEYYFYVCVYKIYITHALEII